ncbi:hypothetical protein PACTADRAFT_36642 [Pachysolen tannophilus NRRL Y-2460]|uniref:Complex 1 LYR protein domain-containing protein n=1 Tax=Pachysolen tannophilus NRRL Y-2460 TaxID=669874 RepID=A0A1E4U0H8_PACTA|nr:hypothetical protein PACTADRAFT_36642 [Pachysolen tannophilus NRRL Y-2460]
MARLSGLQKEVIALYRECIRSAYKKPKENRNHWVNYVHSEFAKYRKLPKKEFATVEHLLRVGHRRFEMYSSDTIRDVH